MMSVRSVLYLLVIINCYRNISAAGIGKSCKKTEECVPQDLTICMGGVCNCITGYVPNPKTNGCIRTVQHGENCEESAQCSYSNETVCMGGTCQCQANLNFNGKRCVGNLRLGEKCNHDYECVVNYDQKQETVWCYNGLCACRDGFRIEEDRCVIGGDCKNDLGCSELDNSFCNILKRDRYHCACRESYIPAANNTKCLPIVFELGRGCEYDDQCSEKLGEAACIQYQCQCREGASVTEDHKCIVYELAKDCVYDVQCSEKLGDAVCVNNHCQCREGALLTEDNKCSAAVGSMISLSCFLLVWLVKFI